LRVNGLPADGSIAIAPDGIPSGAMAFPERGAGGPHFASPARRRYGVFLVLVTLFLIFSGAEVKSRQAGLSVPDWPLSYGMWWPPMVGNVFFEHGHRTIAASVGLLVVVLALWTARTEPRAWVRTLGWWALAAVVAQGLLGGLTVRHLLPPALSISHGVLAQTLLCLLAWIACATSREWALPAAAWQPRRAGLPGAGGAPAALAAGPASAPGSAPAPGREVHARALRAAGWAAGAIYVQLLLGALMRHNEAGLAVPFFPVSASGALLPEHVDAGVVLHMLHRGFAVVVLVLVLLAARRVGQAWAHLARHAFALAALACGQVLLGATIIWTAQPDIDFPATWIKMPVPASLHVLLGAGLLALAWLLCLRCWRAGARARTSAASCPAPAAATIAGGAA
jgi:heme a synthase